MPAVLYCRILGEEPAGTYKGSSRYGLPGENVFWGYVSGGRDKVSIGEFHVWIPPRTIAELSGIPESEIRNCLSERNARFSPTVWLESKDRSFWWNDPVHTFVSDD